MGLKDKPLPKFEVPASYEKYAQGGYVMDADLTEEDTFAQHVPVAMGEGERGGESLSREERISKVIACVGSQNSLREVLYKTLVLCQEPHEFAEVEDWIAEQDEFVHSHILQTPFTLIEMLLRAGGLSQTPLDAQGSPIAGERLDALSDDQADDLVVTYRLQTTDIGREAARLLSPERRLEAQLELRPHRRDTYFAVLDFCQTPRKFPEIEAFFKATPDLVQDTVAHHHKLSPDFYVDKLDKAGALVWRGAWVATDAGRQMLAEHRRTSGLS